MKFFLSLVFSLLLLTSPLPVASVGDVIEKTACTQAIGYKSLDELKKDLLVNAQRLAVNELFGELIEAATAVENFVVTSDQIRASSLGLVRIEGTADYFNGENLAEVCVTIRAYTTEQDRIKFDPVRLTKRHCVTDPNLTTRQLTTFAKDEVIVQALLDYDRRLEKKARSELLRLLQKVNYLEGGFVPDTETYCTRVEGYVIPIEIIAFLESTVSTSSAAASPRLQIYTDSSWLTNHTRSTEWDSLDFNDSTWQSSLIVTYGSWAKLQGMDPQAQWVWNPNAKVNIPIFFRKKFSIDNQPKTAILKISGDNIYKVFINGIYLGEDREWERAETYNIASYLVSGTNVIAVEVIDHGTVGGLIASLRVEY